MGYIDHEKHLSDTHKEKAAQSRTLGMAHWAKADNAHASGNRIAGAVHGAIADRHYRKAQDHENRSNQHAKNHQEATDTAAGHDTRRKF